MRTRIKFCGMTRQQDVKTAVELGVDALGFVFIEDSARHIEVEHAGNLMSNIPPFVTKVGLFMNAQTAAVNRVMQHLDLDVLQFHGDEEEDYCAQFGIPYLKAVPMGSVSSLTEFSSHYDSATGFVLDSHTQGQMGGSGEKFDWRNVFQNIKEELDKPIILAGGLTPENVAEAICVVQPYAVDVSSGIEVAKGIKDHAKMTQFVMKVHRD